MAHNVLRGGSCIAKSGRPPKLIMPRSSSLLPVSGVSLALLVCAACEGSPVGELTPEPGDSGLSSDAPGAAGSAGAAGTVCEAPCALAYDQPVRSLAVDATDVYYSSGHSIWKVPKQGGAPTEIASGLTQPTKLEIASGSVVFLDYRRRIEEVDTTDGSISVLLDDTDPFARYWDIAVNDEVVVLIRTVSDLDGTILSVPRTGGAPTVLAETDVGCWPKYGHGIALSPTHAYWGEGIDIKRVALDGGVVETVSNAEDHAHTLAVGADFVYWANGAGGLLFAPLEGGSGTHLSSDGIVREIALDSAHAYWTSGSSLARSVLGTSYGGTIVNGTSLSDVVADETHIYYGSSNATGLSLARIAK